LSSQPKIHSEKQTMTAMTHLHIKNTWLTCCVYTKLNTAV